MNKIRIKPRHYRSPLENRTRNRVAVGLILGVAILLIIAVGVM